MRRNDAVVIGVTALITAAIATAALNLVPRAIADKGQRVVRPTLEHESVVMYLELDEATCKPDGKPVARLTAANRTDRTATLSVEIVMSTMSPGSEMSRMGPIPSDVWSSSCDIVLRPGETGTFEFPTDVAVASGEVVSFTIKAGGKTVRAAGFSTGTPIIEQG